MAPPTRSKQSSSQWRPPPRNRTRTRSPVTKRVRNTKAASSPPPIATAGATGATKPRDGIQAVVSSLEDKVKRWSYDDYERVMTSDTNWWEEEVVGTTTFTQDSHAGNNNVNDDERKQQRMGVLLGNRVLVKFPGLEGYYLGTVV
eukprot:scaffold571148_cov55-Attheya_sp.AAC.1